MRPKQWIKNLLIFAGLIFSKNLLALDLWIISILAFLLFCLLSGSIYIINDIIDLESDKKHPIKSKRPLPSGQLKVRQAWIAAIIIALFSISLSFVLKIDFGIIALAYFLLILVYSLSLKHIVILDVLVISIGFVMRAAAGALAISVEISPWLLICTILLALFLALGKRRHELLLLENAQEHRRSLEDYSQELLDQMISVVTASTVIAYSLYTMAGETIRKFNTSNLKYTIPFVIYGIFRYLYLIYQKQQGGDPGKALITDRPLILNIALWIATVIILIYLS